MVSSRMVASRWSRCALEGRPGRSPVCDMLNFRSWRNTHVNKLVFLGFVCPSLGTQSPSVKVVVSTTLCEHHTRLSELIHQNLAHRRSSLLFVVLS